MIVIIYAYSGVLTSMWTAPKLEPTVDTLDSLIERDSFCLTAEKGNLYTNILLV